MTTNGIAAILARLQDAYTHLDAAGLATYYAEDCVVDSPVAGLCVGRLAVERSLRTIFSAFLDLSIHTEELLIFGNRAMWMARVEGTDNGGFMGLPPTGKPFTTSVIFLYTFGDDQKIVRERRVYDFSRLLLHLAGEAEPATEGPRLYSEMLERARREHELRIAAEIQQALLPESRHVGAGFEVVATSVPCRAIGGDFFDYFSLASGAFAFVLGDVAGKGPSAALLAAMLQGIFAANTRGDGAPTNTLKQANDTLVRRGIEARFATVFYGVLSGNGELTYCNAGHNPPLLVGSRGVRRLETGGTIIGAFQHATFDQETVQLVPDDVVVAFSDGVTEALNRDGEEFGEERLLSCVEESRKLAPDALLGSLLDAVHQFSAGAVQSDDLTLLVLRYGGESTIAA